jgi:hypothetical protein
MEFGAGEELAQIGVQPKAVRESNPITEEGKQLCRVAMDSASILKERGHKNGRNLKNWRFFCSSNLL